MQPLFVLHIPARHHPIPLPNMASGISDAHWDSTLSLSLHTLFVDPGSIRSVYIFLPDLTSFHYEAMLIWLDRCLWSVLYSTTAVLFGTSSVARLADVF